MTNIKATNLELTDELRSEIDKKMSGIEKFVDVSKIEKVYVEVAKTTNHHQNGDVYRAEFNIFINGDKYNSISESENINQAIDEASADLIRTIKDKKDHDISLFRRGARSVKKMLKGLSKRNPFTSKIEE